MAERTKAAASKAAVPSDRDRGFESLSLRQYKKHDVRQDVSYAHMGSTSYLYDNAFSRSVY